MSHSEEPTKYGCMCKSWVVDWLAAKSLIATHLVVLVGMLSNHLSRHFWSFKVIAIDDGAIAFYHFFLFTLYTGIYWCWTQSEFESVVLQLDTVCSDTCLRASFAPNFVHRKRTYDVVYIWLNIVSCYVVKTNSLPLARVAISLLIQD